MYSEIKVDIDEIHSAVSNSQTNVTPKDYSSEWLTTDCIRSTYTGIFKCINDYNTLIESIKGYASELEHISSINPPDIDKANCKKDTKMTNELK
jgi:hypothetical protein